jgi:large conductance mechanosensitive channel
MLKEFRDFAMKGNVVDLAIGIIIGTAFGAIVASLVRDVVMPPLGLLIGGVDFSNQMLVLKEGSRPFNTPEEAAAAGAVTLNWGAFLNTVIHFLIVALAVFFIVKAMNKMKRQQEATPAAVETSPEVTLLGEIRDLLRARS